MTIAILADDLTGACDAAAPFARRGLATRVLLSPRPVPVSPANGDDVVALDADTRRLSRRLAVSRTSVAAHALHTPEATLLFKKIDSTMRGHVGPELLACMRAWDAPLALLCPAYPAMGRWVQDGALFVDRRGMLGDVATLAGLPADRRTAWISRDVLWSGAEVIEQTLAERAAAGARVIVADADTPGHLTALVAAAMASARPILLAGSAGLGTALAEWAAARRREAVPEAGSVSGPADASTSPILDGDGLPWLVVAGSQTDVTDDQVIELTRAGAEAIELDVDELLGRRSLAVAASRQAAALLRDGVTPVLRLVISPGPDGIRNRGPRLDERAARAMALASQKTIETTAPAGLFLTGGLTARACLLALRVSGLHLEREPLPGIAAGTAVGGAWNGRPVITKAGGFGAPDAMRRLVHPRSPRRATFPTTRSAPPVA